MVFKLPYKLLWCLNSTDTVASLLGVRIMQYYALTHFNHLSSHVYVALGNQNASTFASWQHNFASDYAYVLIFLVVLVLTVI